MMRRKRGKKRKPPPEDNEAEIFDLNELTNVDDADELLLDDYDIEFFKNEMYREAIRRAEKRKTNYIV